MSFYFFIPPPEKIVSLNKILDTALVIILSKVLLIIYEKAVINKHNHQ